MVESNNEFPVRSACSSMALGTAIAAAGLAGGWEWEHYRRAFLWQDLGLNVVDRVVLFWLLWAKTTALLLLPLPLVAPIAALGRPLLARFALGVVSASVIAWMLADLQVRELTGRHVLSYWSHLSDSNPLEWVGGLSQVAAPLSRLLAVAIALSIGAFWLSGQLVRWLVRGRRGHGAARGHSLVAGALIVALLGVLPAERCVSAPAVLTRLHDALPVSLPFEAGDASDTLGFRVAFEQRANEAYERYYQEVVSSHSADREATLPKRSYPDVLILVLECLRHDALEPDVMPHLAEFSARGLRWRRHFAGSNISHYGLFSLLYGRSPLAYHLALDAAAQPQLCVTLGAAGYERTFATSGTLNWGRMDEFINPATFDRVVTDTDGDWCDRDRRILAQVGRVLEGESDHPRCVVAFLMSTHFPYAYPPEYATRQPAHDDFTIPDLHERDALREPLLNRFRNAAGFLDAEIQQLLQRLDLDRTIVVITGDHGESIFDDGTLGHGGKASDVQMRVSMAMVGPGIPSGQIDVATRHADVLPTLLHALGDQTIPIERSHGRDLLGADRIADSVALTPFRAYSPAHLVLVRQERRMRLRFHLDRPRVEMAGFLDETGARDVHYSPSASDAAGWSALLQEELRLMAGADQPVARP